MRFYLIDKVTKMHVGQYVEGVKCISMTDDIFNEHFPGYPVFPGTLIIEGLAQMSGLFLEYCIQKQGLKPLRSVLALVQKFKFRGVVTPGDRLEYRAEVKCFYPEEYAVLKVRASKDGKKVAEGELMFTFLDILDEKMKEVSDSLLRFGLRDAEVTE